MFKDKTQQGMEHVCSWILSIYFITKQIRFQWMSSKFLFGAYRRRNVKTSGWVSPAGAPPPLCWGGPPASGITACGPVAIVHSSWLCVTLLETNRHVISLSFMTKIVYRCVLKIQVRKKNSKTGKIPDIAIFTFWPNKRSDIIRFKFSGQIRNPHIIPQLYNPY